MGICIIAVIYILLSFLFYLFAYFVLCQHFTVKINFETLIIFTITFALIYCFIHFVAHCNTITYKILFFLCCLFPFSLIGVYVKIYMIMTKNINVETKIKQIDDLFKLFTVSEKTQSGGKKRRR